MRMYNLVLMCISVFNTFPSNAQIFHKYEDDGVINLAAYKEGNIYQKDLLLMLDLLRTTHPAFSSELVPPFDVENVKKEGYEFGKSCTSITQFRGYLQSILTPLNDGHTTLLPIVDNSLVYPFALFIDNDRVYLRGINKGNERFLGKEIVQINHQPALKVVNSFRGLISCDNDVYFYDKVDELIQLHTMWQENIHCLLDSTLQFGFSEGEMMTLHPVLKKEINMVALPNNPMSLSIRKNSKFPFLYEILSDKSICYFQFNSCMDQSSLRAQYDMIKGQYNISEEVLEKRLSQIPRFDEFLSVMFDEIRNKNIRTLVVDIRNNSGGNSRLCDVLLSWLKPYSEIKKFTSSVRFSKLWEDTYPSVTNGYKQAFAENKQTFELGKLYDSTFLSFLNSANSVLEEEKYFRLNEDMNLIFKGNIIFIQNSGTYSSAGLLVSTVVDNNIGLLIGTNSSYRPCNYGEILCWELPNTKIKGAISSKIFTRPDMTKCEEETLSPAIHLRQSWIDILENKDVCWEWVLSHY